MFYDKTIIIIVCLKMMFAVHTLEILVSGADFKLSLLVFIRIVCL